MIDQSFQSNFFCVPFLHDDERSPDFYRGLGDICFSFFFQ